MTTLAISNSRSSSANLVSGNTASSPRNTPTTGNSTRQTSVNILREPRLKEGTASHKVIGKTNIVPRK
ncbi:MAG: hypothetical protein BWZ07_03103 [Alphaproteobacteria bacterium ADurb.BinA280]|nr:MAG: hypothetical protein BWZ07_03103 [Alphaproteobacteria bacterium ADurb.BinA280]